MNYLKTLPIELERELHHYAYNRNTGLVVRLFEEFLEFGEKSDYDHVFQELFGEYNLKCKLTFRYHMGNEEFNEFIIDKTDAFTDDFVAGFADTIVNYAAANRDLYGGGKSYNDRRCRVYAGINTFFEMYHYPGRNIFYCSPDGSSLKFFMQHVKISE